MKATRRDNKQNVKERYFEDKGGMCFWSNLRNGIKIIKNKKNTYTIIYSFFPSIPSTVTLALKYKLVNNQNKL